MTDRTLRYSNNGFTHSEGGADKGVALPQHTAERLRLSGLKTFSGYGSELRRSLKKLSQSPR